MVLPTIIIATTASTCTGCSTKMRGSNNMPTATKNKMAKISRRGRVSSSARWLKSESLTTIPAKKAPSAMETPKILYAPKAIETAAATTVKVNSSREPRRATNCMIIGTRRFPMISIKAMKPTTLSKVMPKVSQMLSSALPVRASPPSSTAVAGKSTSTKTMTRSSTKSQPTAILPLTELSRPRSPSALSNTTVLAQDRLKPKTKAEPRLHPQIILTPIPSRVATAICKIAPGNAMRRTCNKSLREKCMPTPNMRNMTPSSANWFAR